MLITALRDEEGDLRGFAKVTRDITTRKVAEERDRLLTLRASGPGEGRYSGKHQRRFFAIDGERRFTYINGKAEQFWGLSRDELLGKNIWEEFPQAVGSEYYRQIQRAMEEGVTTEFEATFPVLGAWVAGRGLPSREGLSVYFQDVTERKRMEESLRRVTGRAQADSARDLHDGVLQDFSYTTAAIGMMVLQAAGREAEEQLQAAVDAVRRGTQSLREVVNDLRLEDEEERPFPRWSGLCEAEPDDGPEAPDKPGGGEEVPRHRWERRNSSLAHNPGGAHQRPQALGGEEGFCERQDG